MSIQLAPIAAQAAQLLGGLGGLHSIIQTGRFYRHPEQDRPPGMDKVGFVVSKMFHLLGTMLLSFAVCSFGVALSVVPATTPLAVAVTNNLSQLVLPAACSIPLFLLSLMIDQGSRP